VKLRLPAELERVSRASVASWREGDGTRRLFARDASLWTGGDEASWLGWLDAPAAARGALPLWSEIAATARGFEHALLLGMGGSSLAPEVQRASLGAEPGHPRLTVLDSIHPDAVAAAEASIDPARTLVVVASKSGGTLEPSLLMARLLATVTRTVGETEAPRRFLAITDPGSALERFARERGFLRVVHGDPTIGGRFSALSPFGLVAAAIQGVPVGRWIARAEAKAAACRAGDPAHNPGVALGLLLAAAAAAGRDKLTLVAHPSIRELGAWLEQLVAESTGKRGLGVLPFDGEPLGPPAVYGDDRLFVALRLGGELGPGDAARLDALADAGQPVAELDLADPLDLAAEFYRWEIATAVAGARLGVHPFDQPDVEAAKVEARRLAGEIGRTGSLPSETALAVDEGLSVFGSGVATGAGVDALLAAHLDRLGAGDYFALLAFVPMSEATLTAAARIRRAVRDRRRVATSVGFGPRYLHSTGQAHKGGPPSGVYLVVTDTAAADLAVPGQRLTFGQAIAAQARGDAAVLEARGRRVLRVHLDEPAADGLGRLAARIEAVA
jgi:transaldolase/glucose-6-phosphate isomerase